MLHALAEGRSAREIWWVHTTRDAQTHAFRQEVSDLVAELPHAQQQVFYTSIRRPAEQPGRSRHWDCREDAAVYMCGPDPFMADMRIALTDAGSIRRTSTPNCSAPCPRSIPASSTSRRRGRIRLPVPQEPDRRCPSPAAGSRSTGPPEYGSILEFAEACDVPTRFSCRSGVCHTCVTQLIAGTTTYTQPPLEPPPDGTVLICIAEPRDGIVLDL